MHANSAAMECNGWLLPKYLVHFGLVGRWWSIGLDLGWIMRKTKARLIVRFYGSHQLTLRILIALIGIAVNGGIIGSAVKSVRLVSSSGGLTLWLLAIACCICLLLLWYVKQGKVVVCYWGGYGIAGSNLES
ncbi:hypothetical protein U1Q18_003107 [Sarracenia purpurea var. burkii]